MLKQFTLLFTLIVLFTNAKAIVVPSIDSAKPSLQSVLPEKINIKKIETAINRKLKFKEKVAIFLYNHKLLPKKLLTNLSDEDDAKAKIKGKRSLLYSIIGWGAVFLSAVVPFLGLGALVLFILSLVNGIQSLNIKKKDNTNAVLGVVFSGLYLLLLLVGLILIIAFLGAL